MYLAKKKKKKDIQLNVWWFSLFLLCCILQHPFLARELPLRLLRSMLDSKLAFQWHKGIFFSFCNM